ncbi:MFS transporter [Chthoniobacter flavus]|nr:MFS transporter [Chthoniobacter flavus]TCO86704.1 MFS transporter [Chthoniobacter flavus]
MSATTEGIAPNAKRLLFAGFMAILAAGVGFAIRGGILANWAADFGFTGAQLGAIGGAGFTGFCFGIIIGGIIADKIGYGKLVVAAFVFHVLSAFVTFGASKGQPQETAYNLLYWGTFIFALANGTLEAVANPLVSTLFPQNRTHYLNILHSSWPAGMVLGALFTSAVGEAHGNSGPLLGWKMQLAAFLLPTILYGVLFLGQKFPKSEASSKGLGIGEMLKDVGILGGAVASYMLVRFFHDAMNLPSPVAWAIGAVALAIVAIVTRFSLGAVLLCVLFIIHAMVGAVELGTDGWIQNITGNILTPTQGKLLFVYTSLFMFGLRFCAHFIEKNLKLSPIGLLCVCAVLASIGLNLVSGIQTFIGAILALSVYALGKTFFWPTMLAVIGDRFPRTGAIAISISGGIGMMSAGLLGSAGLGYAKDRFAADELQKANPAAYAEFKAEKPSTFLFLAPVTGLDGTKLADVQKMKPEERSPAQKAVADSSILGDRRTLKADSFIPATMSICYLLLLIYFMAIGGYKPAQIDMEKITGGIDGPMEA